MCEMESKRRKIWICLFKNQRYENPLVLKPPTHKQPKNEKRKKNNPKFKNSQNFSPKFLAKNLFFFSFPFF